MGFKHLTDITGILLVVSAFGACALPQSPSGGPKDETPPRLIEAESTPNQQTGFQDREIVLVFDEWIVLKDVYTQLIISPPMPEDPEIKQKGKTIRIELPDSLREETTYSIHFGNAIVDLNESNTLDNFAFVFSTGAVLDSHRINGHVIDATTLKPAGGMWVMLYPFGEDSAVYKRKPDFIAKTDKDGKWSIQNLPVDSFQVVTLKDDNLNFLFDQESEWIGWHTDPLITAEPIVTVDQILIFPKEKATVVTEVLQPYPGWVKVIVSGPEPKQRPIFSPAIDDEFTQWQGDTLHLYYSADENYAGKVILGQDTLTVRPATGPSVMTLPLRLASGGGKIHPAGQMEFTAPVPLSDWDTSMFQLVYDTLGEIEFLFQPDSTRSNGFTLQADWRQDGKYRLIILPGAMTDIWERTNDTLRYSWTVGNLEQYGDMNLTIQGLDSTIQHVVLLKNGDKIADQFIIRNTPATTVKRIGLNPATYTIEIIADLNRNGVWDTGDYAKRRPPEVRQIFAPDALRAGWELDVTLTWK